MSNWRIDISGKGIRKASVEKLIEKLRSSLGNGVSINVTNSKPPESRAERLADAMSLVSDARFDVEGLRDELQVWRDNLPENMQSGSKADELDSAIGELDEIMDWMDALEGSDVSFPGMY